MSIPSRRPHVLGVLWVMSLFAAGTVAPLYLSLEPPDGAAGWGVSAGIAAFVSFCVIAVLFWISQVKPLRLPGAWHRLRPFESETTYRRLGVRRFGSVLGATPFRHLNRDVHLRQSDISGLIELDGHMQTAEANHVVGFVLTLAAAVAYGTWLDWRVLPWFAATIVLGNLYPVLLQRMNRVRIRSLISRRHASAGPI